MVSKSLTKSSESLDERADRVAQEQAEISRERAHLDQERHDALIAHQRQVDQETVDSWRPRDLDAAVVAARAALGRAVADNPITKACGDLVYAETARSILWRELLNARGQLGMPVDGAPLPPTTGTPNIQELIFREASNQAEDRLHAEATTRSDHRTIPTEETE